ncbi:MAG: putative monovalent cation/H+ antiporter subunit A [Chloroflexaceae bacterium]
MLAAVLSGFALSSVTPWLRRIGRGATGWLIALLPLGLFIYFGSQVEAIMAGEVLRVSYAWAPSVGINLSFYLDGLSLLFALLITGIGTLVILYTAGYLAEDEHIDRFYAFTLIFMASMLGLVLANNVITLYVFWELTSVSSFLLIGFEHEEEESRAAAWQALLVTGAGGLILLAGLILLGQVGGSMEISTLVEAGEMIRGEALYLPILVLILLGAFTKSAQFPFHFWLPNAMAAPTPASAYLHSATMVKAGVYLLARLSPVLGGTPTWQYTVTSVGAVTMLLGAFLAWQQVDIKRILAYSTVSALGILVMLIGIGTELAAEAMLVFLLGHALYKGALFLVAGAIDHESGTRSLDQLGGLRRAMPITAGAAWIAALSMASLPPFLGFIGKELLYEASLKAHLTEYLLIGVAVLANIFYVGAAGIIGLRPFIGQEADTPKHPHEAPLTMWLGPVVLAGAGLFLGLVPSAAGMVVQPAIAAMTGHAAEIDLALWHGLTLPLFLSVITIAGGAGVYVGRERLMRLAAGPTSLSRWGPDRWYTWALDGLNWVAHEQTRLIQHGYLRYYMLTIVLTLVGFVGFTLLRLTDLPQSLTTQDIRPYEAGLGVLILFGTWMAVRARSRLAAIAALGVVGYSMSLIFVMFSAPDLAMTQFAIETLTVILFVLVLYRLPPFGAGTVRRARLRDAAVALTAGTLIATLVLIATNVQFSPSISDFYIDKSYPEAHGHNIVNVILVDFRELDTMGEITVLSLAGVGVYALLKLILRERKVREEQDE